MGRWTLLRHQNLPIGPLLALHLGQANLQGIHGRLQVVWRQVCVAHGHFYVPVAHQFSDRQQAHALKRGVLKPRTQWQTGRAHDQTA